MSTRWCYQIDGNSYGPVTSRELIELAKKGTLRRTDFIRRENETEWLPARRAPALWADQPAVQASAAPVVVGNVPVSPAKANQVASQHVPPASMPREQDPANGIRADRDGAAGQLSTGLWWRDRRQAIAAVCGCALLLLIFIGWKVIGGQNSSLAPSAPSVAQGEDVPAEPPSLAQKSESGVSAETADSAKPAAAKKIGDNPVNTKVGAAPSNETQPVSSTPAPASSEVKLPAESLMSSNFDPCSVPDLLPCIVEEPAGAGGIFQNEPQPPQTIAVPRRYLGAAVIGQALGQGIGQAMKFRQGVQTISGAVQLLRERWHDALKTGNDLQATQLEFANWLTQKDIYYDVLGSLSGATSDGRAGQIMSLIGGQVDGGIPVSAKSDYPSYMGALEGYHGGEIGERAIRTYLRSRNWYELERTGISFPWEQSDLQYLHVVLSRYGKIRTSAEVDQDCQHLFEQFGEQRVLEAVHTLHAAKRDSATFELSDPSALKAFSRQPDKAVLEMLGSADPGSYLKYAIWRWPSEEAEAGAEPGLLVWAFGQDAVQQAAKNLWAAKRNESGELIDRGAVGCCRGTHTRFNRQGELAEILSKNDSRGQVRWIVARGNTANQQAGVDWAVRRTHDKSPGPAPRQTTAEIESLVQALYQKYGEDKVLQAAASVWHFRDIPEENEKIPITISTPGKATMTVSTPHDFDLAFAIIVGDNALLINSGAGAFSTSKELWANASSHFVNRQSDSQRVRRQSDYALLQSVLVKGSQAVFGDMEEEPSVDNPIFPLWSKFKAGDRVQYEFSDRELMGNRLIKQPIMRAQAYTIRDSSPEDVLLDSTTQVYDVSVNTNSNQESIERHREKPGEQVLISPRISQDDFNLSFGDENRSRYSMALGIPIGFRLLQAMPTEGKETLPVGDRKIPCDHYQFIRHLPLQPRATINEQFWLSDQVPGRLVRWTEDYHDGVRDASVHEVSECKLVSVDENSLPP